MPLYIPMNLHTKQHSILEHLRNMARVVDFGKRHVQLDASDQLNPLQHFQCFFKAEPSLILEINLGLILSEM